MSGGRGTTDDGARTAAGARAAGRARAAAGARAGIGRRRLGAALGAALIGAALAGPALAQAPVPAQAPGPVRARVGVIPVIGAAPLFVANAEGGLRRGGVEAVVTTFESGPNMIQALASGTLDVYVAGVAPLAVARARGVGVRVVAATAVAENVFVAGPALAAELAKRPSLTEGFRAFREAAGRPARLATQPAGSVPNTTLQHWLWEVARADRADAGVLAMGIDATQQALLAGAVDGAILREPAVSIVLGREPRARLIAAGDAMFPGQPGTVVAVSDAFARAHPEAVQGLVNALVDAGELLTKEPERAVPALEAALGKGIIGPDLIRAALRSPATRFVIDPRAIAEPTRRLQAYQVKLGSIDKEEPLEGLFDPRYFEAAARR